MRVVTLLLVLWSVALAAHAQQPTIDVHVHASLPSDGGPVPTAICVPFIPNLPAPRSFDAWPQQFAQRMTNPSCDDPIWSPETPEALMNEVIEELQRNHAVGILSGPPERVNAWKVAAPDRFIKSLQLNLVRDPYTPEEARAYFADGGFLVLGEISNQYVGIGPDDERMKPWWALAEEMNIPVQIHMGGGPPGTISFSPAYRVGLGNPLLLEPVLARHPDLRISVQHMAEGFSEEMIQMLWAYPQLHVDIGGIMWGKDGDYFHAQLKTFVDAGFANRIMFGADAMVWPGLITRSIEIIQAADYLSEQQKQDILFDNAVRFFGFDGAHMRRRALGMESSTAE